MPSSLSKLVDNLTLHNNKRLDCESCLDYIKTKNEKLILKCFNCKTYYEQYFNKELIKRFANTYEFFNGNLNKFILLLRKGAHPYECMDNWEGFDETSLPKESFYGNLGWAMSQKLPVNGFKWVNNEITEEFIKSHDENSDKGYVLKVDVKYPVKLHDLHSDLPFLPKRMKIDKCKKLECNLRNKKKYVVHMKSLKQALNHGFKLKQVHRIIEVNQEAWPKPYIDMNTE